MCKIKGLFIILLLVSIGCNPLSSDDNSDAAVIKPGIYEQRAQIIAVNDSIVTAAPVGSYFSQGFRFYDTGEVRVEVKSDIPSEAGTAEVSSYEASGKELTLNVEESTTPYFQEGKVSYSGYKVVDEDFEKTFGSGSTEYTFEGHGLILEKKQADTQDLDDDGDTSEDMVVTEYFEHVVRYDDL